VSANNKYTVCISQQLQTVLFCIRDAVKSRGCSIRFCPTGAFWISEPPQQTDLCRLQKTAQRLSTGLRTPCPPGLRTWIRIMLVLASLSLTSVGIVRIQYRASEVSEPAAGESEAAVRRGMERSGPERAGSSRARSHDCTGLRRAVVFSRGHAIALA